jgi:hypothetical protein
MNKHSIKLNKGVRGGMEYDKDEFKRIRRKHFPKIVPFVILQWTFLIFYWFDLYIPHKVSLGLAGICLIPFAYFYWGA